MKLSKKAVSLAIFSALVASAAACGGSQPATTANSTNTNQTNSAPTPVNTATAPETALASNVSLATPTETYKAAYAARKAGDIEALKRVLDDDILDFFKEMGEAEGKTVDDMLKDLASRPQAEKAESRNEKINGDKATLEYLDEDGKWQTMDFVKVGNEWKLSFPDMKQDAPSQK